MKTRVRHCNVSPCIIMHIRLALSTHRINACFNTRVKYFGKKKFEESPFSPRSLPHEPRIFSRPSLARDTNPPAYMASECLARSLADDSVRRVPPSVRPSVRCPYKPRCVTSERASEDISLGATTSPAACCSPPARSLSCFSPVAPRTEREREKSKERAKEGSDVGAITFTPIFGNSAPYSESIRIKEDIFSFFKFHVSGIVCRSDRVSFWRSGRPRPD